MRLRALLIALLTTVVSLIGISSANAASYRLDQIGLPDGTSEVARWNPCQASITYKVNVAKIHGERAKRSAVRVTKASVARVKDATGMRFSYKGRTRMVPRSGNLSSQNTAEIVIAFATPAQTNYPLKGSVAGYGGWQASYGKQDGSYVAAIARGFVVIDNPQTRSWPNGVRRRGLTRANIISHELGHAVGLGHVDDPHQLMNPTLRTGAPVGFARGDRVGLRKVGRPAGCIDASWMVNDG